MCVRLCIARRSELSGVCRFISPHRGSASNDDDDDGEFLCLYNSERPVYTTEYAESVKPRHKDPEKVRHCLLQIGCLPVAREGFWA